MSRSAGLREQLRSRLRELGSAGLDGLTRPPTIAELRSAADGEPVPAKAVAQPSPSATAAPEERGLAADAPRREWAALDLGELAAWLADCRRCKLCEDRRQVVFGVGAAEARLMFVGEGPGRDEDLQGEPFVGKAGRLLTDMIQKGMGLRREEVYIANVVKCRPPRNRDPEPDEVEACEGFLRRQVELVQPEVIVALGRFAAQCLLRNKLPIGRLRGQWKEYAGIPLMPTFHPAYLLRSPAEKRSAWVDLQAVMERLGLPPKS